MTPIPIPEDFRNWAKLYADGNSIDAHPKIREHLNAELYEAAINTYRHIASQQTMRWVKASEQLPEREKPIFFEIEWSDGKCSKFAGKFMFVLNEDCFVANAISYPIRKYVNTTRWLDEYPSPIQ